ncbi:hypothetical protein Plhal703r1_c23g0098341 [Plasmopara halstedii]
MSTVLISTAVMVKLLETSFHLIVSNCSRIRPARQQSYASRNPLQYATALAATR